MGLGRNGFCVEGGKPIKLSGIHTIFSGKGGYRRALYWSHHTLQPHKLLLGAGAAH